MRGIALEQALGLRKLKKKKKDEEKIEKRGKQTRKE
jgi:hypothetical protein